MGWEFAAYGGLETRVRWLTETLVRRGWQVRLVSGPPLPDGDWSRSVLRTVRSADSVRELWARTPRGRAARAAGFGAHVARHRSIPDADERTRLGHRSISSYINRFWDEGSPGAALLADSDVVLLVGEPKHTVRSALAAAARAGKPAVYQTVHRIDAAWVDRWQYRGFVAQANRCSLIIASHQRQAGEVAEHLRYRGDVLVVPQWCYEEEDELLALEPPAGGGPLRIGALCRFDRVKGLDVLVDATTAAVAAGADCHLVLGGSGDEEADLRRRGAALASAGRLHLPGRVTERARFYDGLDVAVISSRKESGPITGVEAMAAARAVVTTPVGAMPERLEDGTSGCFVDVDDVEEMAAALRSLAGDRDLVRFLGSAARATYVERFRSSLQEERLVSALTGLAERPPVSP